MKISLDEAKFINYLGNNKSPGNDDLTAEFYKHFPNELSLVFLDIYDYWEKPGTMVTISGARIISVIYKFKRYLKNCPSRKIAPRLGLGFESRSLLMKCHEMSHDNAVFNFTETEHVIDHSFLQFLDWLKYFT